MPMVSTSTRVARLARLVLCLFAFLSTGCLGPVKGVWPAPAGEPSFELLVVDNHWHTGLVMRRDLLSPRLQQMYAREATAEHVEIGWGDDGFYRSDHVTSGLALQAIFFSRGSVMHVVALDEPAATHYAKYEVDLHRIVISREGLNRLNAYLEASTATDEQGNSIYLQPGLESHSSFYKARGRYAGWRTCNHWTARAIRHTGFPITPAYATFASNVGWQIERHSAK